MDARTAFSQVFAFVVKLVVKRKKRCLNVMDYTGRNFMFVNRTAAVRLVLKVFQKL